MFKKILIIGCGNIGQDLVTLLKPFNCRVLVNDIRDYQDFYRCNNLEARTLESLLINSDIVTLHVPLDRTTKNMISRERLSLMKSNSILINTARGGLIDENALAFALKEKKIAGAGLDVFNNEPYSGPLSKLDNVILTPHIGSYAKELRVQMEIEAVENLIRGLNEE